MKVTAGLLVLACSQSYAGDNYWKKFEGKTAPSRNPMTVTTKEYNVFSLDQNAMRSFLFALSTDPNQAQSIQLPTPNKEFKNYHIWKTPVMEPGLAERYPDLQTFTAVSDEDPNITAKVEYTLFGFSAMVYDGRSTYFVDPYNHDADGYYVSYYKKDFLPNVPHGPCLVNESSITTDASNHQEVVGSEDGKLGAKTNGNVRHTYRLALSCTGEYAINAVGSPTPTKPQVLSVMIATVNHINGYYEREFSVSMNLIANNDAIIYTDGATDPYTCNLNLNCLIDEVNTNINNVIGTANYDIGHIFCTAGGGLAQLSAVCASGGKARGTSTSGGANDVSTTLHEIGHQFSANHTFNSDAGGCSGNGNATTAYEPGAGISTMSYSGLCDPDNVGSPQDDYFNVNTLLEVSNFLAPSGQGSSCGTKVTTNVNAVTLPPVTDFYYIPQNTPFELTAPIATATQATASILYNWEQWDLGNNGAPEAGAATAQEDGPLFKSYYPTTSRIRAYPEYTNIISGNYGDGTTGKGQRIAKRARYINFKLTARSIYQGWGVFQFIDNTLKIKVDETASTFRVTSQAAASTWNPGSTQTVTWDVAQTTADSVKCGWVNIYLSKDGGETFPLLLVVNAPNTGSYSFTMPDVYSTTGRVKVKGAGNIFYDINKADILFNGNPNGTGIKNTVLTSLVSIYPNPANDRLIVANKNAHSSNLKGMLYNAIGQQVWSGLLGSQTEIAVGGFARGTYLLQVIDEASGARSTEKVVLK